MASRTPVAATTVDPRIVRLKQELAELAPDLLRFHRVPYADRTPSDAADAVRTVRRIASDALTALQKLNLAHTEGQDIETTPFNWPVVQALQTGAFVGRVKRGRAGPEAAPADAYPTEVLHALAELRDAADEALRLEAPGRGNAPTRTAEQALIDAAGKSFVLRYRQAFGRFPPLSAADPAVDALEQFLEQLHVPDRDAVGVLRRAVEKQKRAAAPDAKRRTDCAK